MTTCSSCGFESEADFKFCPECGARQVDEVVSGDPLIGVTLGGKYRVSEAIGSGSMGRVYSAEHVTLKKRVALKVLHRDLQVSDDVISRFQREGIAAGQISHPGVLQIFDFERTDDDLCYLAMEFVDGVDLKKWLSERGALEPDAAIDMISDILATLAEAHRHGVVHRDLKPENIMVSESSMGSLSIKVLDFGLSKLVNTRLDLTARTIPGRIMGTPLYMAPEQWRGEPADHRADLYAATVILYEMLAGKQPFFASDITEVMIQATQKDPPALSETQTQHDVPGWLDVIVQRGLAKVREERFQSAHEMLNALESAASGGALPAEFSKPRTRRRTERRRAPAKSARPGKLGVAIGSVLALGLVVSAWFLFKGDGASSAASFELLSSRDREGLDPSQTLYVSLLEDARASLAKGDLSAADTFSSKAAAMECADPESHVVRGDVMRRRGDFDDALVEYRAASVKLTSYAAPQAGLGWAYFETGDFDRAAQRFDKALELEDGLPAAVAGKAAVLFQRGNAPEARRLLDAAIAGDSQNADLLVWRGRVQLALEEVDAAIESLEQARKFGARTELVAVSLGDAYRAKGDSDSAARQYRDAMQADENADDARRSLAELLLESEKYAEAESVLTPALARGGGNDAELHVLSALAAAGREDFRRAISELETARSLKPKDPVRVLSLLASLQLAEGDFQRAADNCEAAAEIDEFRPDIYSTWGLAQFRLGDYRRAAKTLDTAVDLNPRDPFLRYTLGVVFMDYLGNVERAKEQFEAYFDCGGTDTRVRGWLRRLNGG